MDPFRFQPDVENKPIDFVADFISQVSVFRAKTGLTPNTVIISSRMPGPMREFLVAVRENLPDVRVTITSETFNTRPLWILMYQDRPDPTVVKPVVYCPEQHSAP